MMRVVSAKQHSLANARAHPRSWAEPQRTVRTGGPAKTRRRAEVVAPYKGRVYAKKMR